MALAPEQLNQLVDWLARARLQWPICPLCGAHDWNACADLQAVALLPAPIGDVYWTHTEMARVGCGQCSFSVLVPAEAIGLEIVEKKSLAMSRAEIDLQRDVCEFSDVYRRW